LVKLEVMVLGSSRVETVFSDFEICGWVIRWNGTFPEYSFQPIKERAARMFNSTELLECSILPRTVEFKYVCM
jgi:hypothetical protein